MGVAPEAARTEHSGAGVASFVLSGILFLIVLLVLILNLAALEFGIAGAVQQRRKRSFAVFGTAISVLTFVVAYIQDVLW